MLIATALTGRTFKGGWPASWFASIDWATVLPVLDDVLLGVGGAVAVGFLVVWIRRRCSNPLLPDTDVPNSLSPEGVLFPFFVWLLAGGIAATVVDSSTSASPIGVEGFLAGQVAPLAGALACLWVASRCFTGGVSAFVFGKGTLARNVMLGCVIMPASLALCHLVYFGTVELIDVVAPNYQFFDHTVVDAIRNGKTMLWMAWIGTAVMAPISEELFFRGIIQTCLGNCLKSRWLTVALSAMIFGVIHAGGGDSPQPHVVPALTILGVVLGMLYMRTGSLVAPIVLHALFNAKTLLWESLVHVGG